MIEKRTIERLRTVVITPAQKRMIETGTCREVTIVQADGTRETRLEPILREEITPPVTRTETQRIDAFIVVDPKTQEEHVFLNEQDALKFDVHPKGE